jgi:hypothetical protein
VRIFGSNGLGREEETVERERERDAVETTERDARVRGAAAK